MPARLCFVGYGAIARYHAEIMGAAGAVLHALVGRAPEETAHFAAEFGFLKHTLDLDAALAQPEVDAVVIASPSAAHYQHTRRALLAGKDVLCELPLAMSYAEGSQLVELAKGQGRLLMVAHSLRFVQTLAALRQRLAEGSLHLYHVVARSNLLRRENVGWTGRRRSWTDNLLWHHGCHVVDLSLWLLGADRVEVAAQVARPHPRLGIPMDMDLSLRTPADQLVAISLSYNDHLNFGDFLFLGEEESLYYSRGRLVGPEGVRDDPSARGLNSQRLSWEAQDREFLAALRERRQPAVSGADVLPALAVLQEVQDRFMPPGTSEGAAGQG